MLVYFLFTVLVIVVPLVSSLPASPSINSNIARRIDVSFSCECVDHWVLHHRGWLRASSTDGCMTLETIPAMMYALNALTIPPYKSNNYPNLVCSLKQKRCQWSYSPLDYPEPAANTTSPTGSEGHLSPLPPSDAPDVTQKFPPTCEYIPKTTDSASDGDDAHPVLSILNVRPA